MTTNKNNINNINNLIKEINFCKKYNFNLYYIVKNLYGINIKIINILNSQDKLTYKEIIDNQELNYKWFNKEFSDQKAIDASVLNYIYAPYLREQFINIDNSIHSTRKIPKKVFDSFKMFPNIENMSQKDIENMSKTDIEFLISFLEYSNNCFIEYSHELYVNNQNLSKYYLEFVKLFV
jgi:hypothetical protein